MWLFTTIGFFSATLTNKSYRELPKKQQTGHIMVRARVRDDLERLVELHMDAVPPTPHYKAPEILALPGHDYPYRIVVPHKDWVHLATRLAEMIDYSNFKSAVDKALPGEEGYARHDLYMKVWSVMNGAERWLKQRVERTKVRDKGQGYLAFWARSRGYLDDPRTDEEMNTHYSDRGWEEWLEEDERAAIVMDPPKPKRRRGKKGRKAS